MDASSTRVSEMDQIEMESASLTGDPSVHSKSESRWYQRKTLVKEVFYVQTLMILTVVIASIVNIAMGVTDCDQQMWVLFLSSAVGHLLPSPDIGKKLKEVDPMIVRSPSNSDKKSTFSISTWHKRTIQHREVFYIQTLIVYIVILTSIVNLSLNVGEKNTWIILLSGSFAQMLPSPKFGKKKHASNV